MIKRTFKILNGVHGSAMIVALVTTVVLATLALAIITLTMGNLTVSQSDALNNDAYYAAESGVNSALELLKGEVLDYYHQMAEASSNEYSNLYDNFFAGISNNAQNHFEFVKPLFGGGLTIEDTTFTVGGFDSSNNVGELLISCTAKASDDSHYRVDAKLYVKRVDVSTPSWLVIDDVAYKIGGTLNLNSGYGVYNGGSVITSAFNNPKNIYFYVQPPGKFVINPNTYDSINDSLTYPSYSNPVLGTPDVYVTVNNTVLGCGSFPTNRPIIIESAPGISFTVGNGTDIYPGSIIYKRGAGTLTLSTSNSNHTFTAFSDGNVVTKNGPVYANIYCRGDVSTSGNFHGNVYADGNCINACNTFVGTMIVNGTLNCNGGLTGSFFAGGALTINNGVNGNSVIYSKTSITLGNGNYANAVLFSGGSINVNGGSSLTGAIIAKGSVNQNAWLTLSYSRAAVEAIMNDPNNSFFFAGAGGGDVNDDEDIIVDQEITAIGRQN